MHGRLRGSGTRARGAPLGAATLALACLVGWSANGSAQAADEAGAGSSAGSREFTIGLLTGSIQLDPSLSRFQWDVAPRLTWGGQAMAGIGRLGLGVRVLETQTTQTADVSGSSASPTVREASCELVVNARLGRPFGVEVFALGSTGLVHLGYHPDAMTLDVSGTPIEVDFRPVNEWIAGGGLAARHALVGSWRAGGELEWRRFSMDTAHRNGNVIETGREAFDDWSVRLELLRRIGR